MKRPSFQFYPSDWLQDASLRLCSVGARGLWIDMICIMHQGSKYGFLKVGDKVILSTNLARLVGSTLEETEGWLIELRDAGVFSTDEENCIFSRRMIRDEDVRNKRAEGGILGGNPQLKKGSMKVVDKVNLNDNLVPTPSSSSSSSSSSLIIIPPTPKGDDKEDDCISRLRSLFRMREATPLSKKDKTSLKNGESIVRTASNEEWELLEWHHSQQKGSGQPGEFCKGSISALLNDWNGALNNARKSKSNTTQHQHIPEKSKYADAF